MNKNGKMTIGWRIASIRDQHNKTLEEFGKIIDGASKSNVSKWEKGEVLPNRKRLKMIADYAGIHVNELLFGTLEYYALNIFFDTMKDYLDQCNEKEQGDSIIRLLDVNEIKDAFDAWLSENVDKYSFDDEEVFREKTLECIKNNLEYHKKKNPVTPKDAILNTFDKVHDAQLDLKDYFYFGEEDSDGNVKLVLREGMSQELHNALESILLNSQNQIDFLLDIFKLDEDNQ